MKVYIKKGAYYDGADIADQLGLEYGHDEEIDENTESEEIDVEFVFEGDEENE